VKRARRAIETVPECQRCRFGGLLHSDKIIQDQLMRNAGKKKRRNFLLEGNLVRVSLRGKTEMGSIPWVTQPKCLFLEKRHSKYWRVMAGIPWNRNRNRCTCPQLSRKKEDNVRY